MTSKLELRNAINAFVTRDAYGRMYSNVIGADVQRVKLWALRRQINVKKLQNYLEECGFYNVKITQSQGGKGLTATIDLTILAMGHQINIFAPSDRDCNTTPLLPTTVLVKPKLTEAKAKAVKSAVNKALKAIAKAHGVGLHIGALNTRSPRSRSAIFYIFI